MIQLRLFGTVDLRHADGVAIDSILAQPKRTALLAYLLAEPGALKGRPTLLGMFWPDLAEARARNGLSKSIHHLRRSLGADAIVGRGDGSLGVASDRVWCDVVAFGEAVEREPAGALDLYARGPFLDGFTLSDAPAFEHWLDGRRASFQRQAMEAARRALDAASRAQDTTTALAVVRRAMEIDPYDEPMLRELLLLLDGAGDRAGAIAAYQAFEARLAEDLEIGPAPETEALAHDIRSRDAPAFAVASVPAALAPAERRAPASVRDPSRGGGRLRWLAGALFAVLVMVMVVQGLRNARQGAGPGPRRVVVAGFENRTGDAEFDLLGDAARDWITQGLQQVGLLEVVDPLSAALAAQRIGSSSPNVTDLARAAAIAQEAGADIAVWGAVYRAGDSLQYRVNITELSTGRLLFALDPIAAPRTAPLSGAEEVRSRVAGALATHLDARVSSLSPTGSSPPEFAAYREYVLGLAAFRSNRLPEAVEHFAAAWRSDTTFFLPLVWNIQTYTLLEAQPKADSVLAVLVSRRVSLPPFERHAADYFAASEPCAPGRPPPCPARSPDAQLGAAREAARLSPGSNWSQTLAVLLMMRNRPREALDHLQEIDAQHGWARDYAHYWNALRRVLHQLGRYEEELASIQRYGELSQGGPTPFAFEAMALLGLGRAEQAFARVEDVLRAPPDRADQSPVQALQAVALEMRAHGAPDLAERTLELAIAWPRTQAAERWVEIRPVSDRDRARDLLERDLGEALYAARRWDAAEALFEAHLQANSTDYLARLYIGRLAARRGDRERAERTLQWLARQREYGPAAQIAALLGDRVGALEYLRLGISHGVLDNNLLHRGEDLELLFDDPAYRELQRPAG